MWKWCFSSFIYDTYSLSIQFTISDLKYICFLGDTNDTGSIAFPTVLYDGLYSNKDGHPKIELKEEINVITNELNNNLQLEVMGGKDTIQDQQKNTNLNLKEIITCSYNYSDQIKCGQQ